MKRNFLSFGMALVLIATSVSVVSTMGGCTKKASTTAVTVKTTSTTATTAANTPQYGGTLTQYLFGGEAPSADQCDAYWPTIMYTGPVIEFLMMGDFQKYGPRGTDEYDFKIERVIPEQYLKGSLTTSWEATANTITLNIRQGVYWTGKAGVMDKREYTADDTAFSLNRFVNSAAGASLPKDWITSIEATNQWTCVVNTTSYNGAWIELLCKGWGNGQYAPEVVKAGASNWNNLVGTGPFMVDSYVVGSAMTYVRNPDYWDKATINGKQYNIPFIDKLVYPIVPDESTQIALLRTGKIDLSYVVSMKYQSTLTTDTPLLLKDKWLHSMCSYVALNSSNKYLSNLQVRRALMMAVDRKAINTAIYTEGDPNAWVVSSQVGTSVYTPFAQLPQDVQEDFTYNPVMAQQLLTAAGYSNGFTLDMIVRSTASSSTWTDMATMVSGYWSKVGVTLNIHTMEDVAFTNLSLSHTGYDVLSENAAHNNPLETLCSEYVPGQSHNFVNYNDSNYTAMFNRAASMTDATARAAIFKQLNVMALQQALYIPIGADYQMTCFWPWVKNYYYEYEVGAWDNGPCIATAWIDQTLKKQMGY